MSQLWDTASVADCLVPVSTAGRTKIQTRDYKPAGRFPVIDQGQEQIAGWTDDESAVIDSPLPLIVFGDHTRAFKFVDRPFARGADGTQLLRPKASIDPLFFFYACRAIDLPARGYNRHFTVLKEKELSYPVNANEQQSVAGVLHKAELALQQQTTLLGNLQELKRAAMRELFTRGLRGEAQKETEIGLVPESWELAPIGAHHAVVSGGTPSRGNPAFWSGGTIPWAKTTEVDYCVITETEEHITPLGLESSAAKMLPAGTLLMAMYGQGITRGKVAILGIEATCNQACAAITPKDDAVLPRYLYHFLTWRYEAIRSLAHGGQQQNLNLEIVRDLPVVYPQSKDEQDEIVTILDAIDRKIDLHRAKREVLEELFESLLRKLMTGEIAVSDLDLSALSPASTQHEEATA
ncbi:restriction endonuclease subunit S [Cupriavidus gilardii]|uniref:Restriction endonuclease subunit S n=1 Tax=Cupriavidus gilardii TaxID=82541 RepID=A0A849B6A0_9BURK|nr:restriction endonuclease subunit S [Cupriavidus gilardii]KAB0598708.1 restriction endonuclease subunit S [Cupriavidus gilardii]NNH09493.1 restriction endonuclease subunit S [Cupriavidus gilardii]